MKKDVGHLPLAECPYNECIYSRQAYTAASFYQIIIGKDALHNQGWIRKISPSGNDIWLSGDDHFH